MADALLTWVDLDEARYTDQSQLREKIGEGRRLKVKKKLQPKEESDTERGCGITRWMPVCTAGDKMAGHLQVTLFIATYWFMPI